MRYIILNVNVKAFNKNVMRSFGSLGKQIPAC